MSSDRGGTQHGERWTISKQPAKETSRAIRLWVDGPDTESVVVVRASVTDRLAEALEVAERAVECRWNWHTYKAALETAGVDRAALHSYRERERE